MITPSHDKPCGGAQDLLEYKNFLYEHRVTMGCGSSTAVPKTSAPAQAEPARTPKDEAVRPHSPFSSSLPLFHNGDGIIVYPLGFEDTLLVLL